MGQGWHTLATHLGALVLTDFGDSHSVLCSVVLQALGPEQCARSADSMTEEHKELTPSRNGASGIAEACCLLLTVSWLSVQSLPVLPD